MMLPNGTVFPSALFSLSEDSATNVYDKNYKNFALRVGIIAEYIPSNSPKSVNKVYPEYNVTVYEQNGKAGGTPTLYKNCTTAQGFGSIADYFEYGLRGQETKFNGGNGVDSYGQDGALVLMLCINGQGDRGIIVSALGHPNRPSSLKPDELGLFFEYNGVKLSIDNEGALGFSFNGATDSFGKPVDKAQGTTSVSIDKEGTLKIQNKAATYIIAKSGDVTTTASGSSTLSVNKNINMSANKGGVTLSTSGDTLNVKTKGDLASSIKGNLTVESSSGSIKVNNSLAIKAQQIEMEAQIMAGIKAPQITMDGLCFVGGKAGLPIPTLVSTYLGVSAMGLVMSNCISGFSTKVFAT